MSTTQLTASLATLLLLISSTAVGASKKEVSYPMKYEGGSLPLQQHDGVKMILEPERITVVQRKERHAIPVKSITEISYGNDVHRRVGAAVGVGIVTLGVGALLALAKTKKHYVGLTWSDSESVKKGGVVFKVGKGEYRGVIAAVEGLTGLKAVNADNGGTSKP